MTVDDVYRIKCYIHVYHVKKGWAVRRSGALRVIAYYPERRDAITRAKDYLIRRGGGTYYVHRKDGRIGSKRQVTKLHNDSTTNVASEAKLVVSNALTKGSKPASNS